MNPRRPISSASCLPSPPVTLRIRPLVVALLGAAAVLSVQASRAATPAAPASGAAASSTSAGTSSAETRQYDIAPSTLSQALSRYAAEAGVVLVFDAAQLGGLKSRGLVGRFELKAGFAALLADTELEAVPTPSGGYLIRRRADPARGAAAAKPGAKGIALTDQPSAAATRALPMVAVSGAAPGTVNTLDKTMLRTLAAVNGDFTSQLKINPNVQFDEGQLSSYTGGEIAPAEISIHGAKPYQNEILLDGVSLMNDLDPGNKVTTTSVDMIPGASQSLAIDSSILCEVGVRDANVSAEYGRFTGGVVEARICNARKKFGGNVSVGYTSSAWTHVFIDPARLDEFENSSNADLQPRFQKRTYKATVEGRPSAEWGVLASVTRRESDIPLKRFSSTNAGTSESREVTQHRTQDMLVLKTDYAPAGGVHKADLSLVYAPSDNTYFMENYRDSDYTIRTGGLNLAGRWESAFDFGTVTHQLSYGTNEQSRRSDADVYRQWRWSTDKNWGDPDNGTNPTSGEGARGDVDQKLRTVGYKLKSAFKKATLGSTTHRVVTGLELRRQDASYERMRDHFYYLTVADLPTTGAISRCQFADGSVDTEACSATPTLKQGKGQYFRRLQTYQAGRFDMQSDAWSAFVEDEASWRQFTLRAGVRADHESLTQTTNTSPRLSLTWAPQDALALDVGANRYYGRSLFAYALQEKINTLLAVQTRNGTLTWGAPEQSKPANRLESMKTPHDDELSAGVTVEPAWMNGPLTLRFTHREGKDQVVKRTITKQTECNASQCYVYTNDGRSTTKDWTLSWSNAQAFKTGPVVTRMWLAVNKSDTRSNVASYADPFGATALDDSIIQYDGRFIHYSDRPADNYNRPWTLRVGAISTMPSRQLTVSNMLRLRGSYQQMLKTGTTTYQGASVDVYERVSLPRSFAVDTVIQWEPRIRADQRLSIKLTVENITNRKNMTTVASTYASYERGRTVALEAGYDF